MKTQKITLADVKRPRGGFKTKTRLKAGRGDLEANADKAGAAPRANNEDKIAS